MINEYKVLLNKEIYEFFQGNGKSDLFTYNNVAYGMPYYTATDLCGVCRLFGVSGNLVGSRWTIVESLFLHAIAENRMDDVLSYFFALERFTALRELNDMNEIEYVHAGIVNSAIIHINTIIKLSRKELVEINHRYCIIDTGRNNIIDSPKIESLNLSYIQDLQIRCKNDFIERNYDSVITKSRTLIEEVLIHILEEANVSPSESGQIGTLYNQVKDVRNMHQCSKYDKRVNGLLSGLEKIVSNIGDMRNINSDAHGVGRNRININEKEARLVMNAAISFCEYIL